jgi:amino acid transporter
MPNPEPIALRRCISLPLLTFYGLGNILGAGIYVLVGKVAGVAGLFAPLAFLLAALVAGFTALAYAELAARFPVSAGESVYVQQGFGWTPLARLVGLLVLLVGIISSATLARGFVAYLQVFVTLPEWLVLTLLAAALGGLAAWGVSESLRLAALFTLIEIGGLLLVLWAAAPALGQIPERLPTLNPGLDGGAWGGILLGAFVAFYAFIGFEDMVKMGEEVDRPERNFPLAIGISLVVVCLFYLSVSIAAVLSLPSDHLAASDAPLALVYQQHRPGEPLMLSLIALFAVVNGALLQVVMGSRILYGMARQGWLPSLLGRVDARTRTPLPATLVVSLLVLVFALWLPLLTLAKLTSFVVLSLFCLVNLSLLRVRRRHAAPPGVRVYPGWLPGLGLACCLGLLVAELAGQVFS